MQHRLAILREQQQCTKTTSLRAQYQINMEQIQLMLEKEPPSVKQPHATLEEELAAQILALDDADAEVES